MCIRDSVLYRTIRRRVFALLAVNILTERSGLSASDAHFRCLRTILGGGPTLALVRGGEAAAISGGACPRIGHASGAVARRWPARVRGRWARSTAGGRARRAGTAGRPGRRDGRG